MHLNELDVMLQDLSKQHYAATTDYSASTYSDFDPFLNAQAQARPQQNQDKTAPPPARPPPPKEFREATAGGGSEYSGHSSSVQTKIFRRPAHPPKLQHILTDGKAHDLVKKVPREDDPVEVPEFSDYDGDYGSTLPDYGFTSSYSTLTKGKYVPQFHCNDILQSRSHTVPVILSHSFTVTMSHSLVVILSYCHNVPQS